MDFESLLNLLLLLVILLLLRKLLLIFHKFSNLLFLYHYMLTSLIASILYLFCSWVLLLLFKFLPQLYKALWERNWLLILQMSELLVGLRLFDEVWLVPILLCLVLIFVHLVPQRRDHLPLRLWALCVHGIHTHPCLAWLVIDISVPLKNLLGVLEEILQVVWLLSKNGRGIESILSLGLLTLSVDFLELLDDFFSNIDKL